MPNPVVQIEDLVNIGSLQSSLVKAKAFSEYYTDKNALFDIRFENNSLKFYTKEELAKEVTAEEATAEKPAYAPVPAAIIDLPREQFLDELDFKPAFNFATWNVEGLGAGEAKIDAEDYAGYGHGIVITAGEDEDPDTSDLDGLPVLIFKYNVQEPITDKNSKDGTAFEYTETYTFIDMSEIMDFHVASNAEVSAMLDEIFPELV